MRGHLVNRIDKAEQCFALRPSAEIYIEAMMRYLSSEDDGEALQALPDLESSGAAINRHEFQMVATARLQVKAKLEGQPFKLRPDLQQEVDRRMRGAGCLIS